jgi:hypothetical protein
MSGPERGAHHTAFFTEFNGHSHALSTTAAVNENGSHCLTGGSTKKEATDKRMCKREDYRMRLLGEQ